MFAIYLFLADDLITENQELQQEIEKKSRRLENIKKVLHVRRKMVFE